MDRNNPIGSTVHYQSHGTPVREDGTQAHPSKCRAAIVTAVPDNYDATDRDTWDLSLAVLNPSGLFFDQGVPHGPGPGGWHEPYEGCAD
jgi:hypothetical protein